MSKLMCTGWSAARLQEPQDTAADVQRGPSLRSKPQSRDRRCPGPIPPASCVGEQSHLVTAVEQTWASCWVEHIQGLNESLLGVIRGPDLGDRAVCPTVAR